jgi:CRP-like cAMP-binding protein
MATKEELKAIPAFSDLPDDQIEWFLSQASELHVKAGEPYMRQGDPADAMYVILEGELQGRGEFGGEVFIFTTKSGEITGVLPFSRMKTFSVGGRAVIDSRALRFPRTQFQELVHRMPELTERLVGMMFDRIREVTRVEQ